MSGGGIVPGPSGGGATLPDDPAAASAVIVDAPSRIIGTNASGVGAALTGPQARAIAGELYVDPMTGATWTAGASGGGATAVWSGGALALTTQNGVAGDIETTATAVQPAADHFDVYLRCAVTTGDVAAGAAGSFTFKAGANATNFVQAQIKSNGEVETYTVNAGAYTLLTVSSPTGITSGQRTGGQLWYRWTRTPTGVAFLWGVGAAGALPTSWTIWRSYPNALAAQATQGTRVSLQIVAGVVAGGYAVTFYAIRATGFAVGPL